MKQRGTVHLKHTIIQIRKKTNAPIIVMGNYMFFNRDVPDMVISYGSTSMNDHYKKNLMWHSFAFDNELKFLAEELGFIFVSKKELLCHGEDCPLLFNDKLFTYDRHHFSMAAAQQMGVELKARYNKYFLGLANGTTENRQQENFN